MKGGAREGAGRKKKAQRKSSSSAIKKNSSVKKTVLVRAEKRPNKHHSYLKIPKDEETGDYQMAPSSGENKFYMGTYDDDLTITIINQVFNICFTGNQSKEIKIIQTNAAMAAILEIDPQDATELMLATQMVAAHNIAMEMSRRSLLVDGQTDEVVNFNVNRMTKLMRTYTTQMEALNKYRTKGQQKITVQHVNVNDGGQAVIGDVNQGGGNE